MASELPRTDKRIREWAELRGKAVRLVLKLHADGRGVRLPVHYNELVQAMIYTHLDHCLARSLHDEGIVEGKRHLKLFTFSRLLGPCRVQGGWVEPQGPLHLVVASPMVPFLEFFALHLVRNGAVHLGPVRFAVESVEVEFDQVYQSPVVLRALSPITVYSTLQAAGGGRKTYYYAPQEPEFERLILANLRRKIRAWTGQDISEDGAFLRAYKVSTRNHHIVLYKGTVIKGWTGLYQLHAPEPYLRMALDAGLGSKNSQGFGCVEVWKRSRASGNPKRPERKTRGVEGGNEHATR